MSSQEAQMLPLAVTSEDVLFLGKRNSVVSWVRTGLPAFYLGCDWVAAQGEPNELEVITALSKNGMAKPNFSDYRIVVLQQVSGAKWQNFIYKLRDKGIKVLYEIDDHIQSVHKVDGHLSADLYTKKYCKEHEICMSASDGVIVSTEFLARKYRQFNKNIFVAKNCVDSKRYDRFDLPERDTINIGWAGGEGHQGAVPPWLKQIDMLMDEYPQVRFISIGLQFAKLIAHRHQKKTVQLPFVAYENFPALLCNLDIAIAPAGKNDFFRAKSDLRFLETGALGIPLVADPFVYDDIEHGKTGILVHDMDDLLAFLGSLVDSPEKRQQIGKAAKDHVSSKRDIEQGVDQWIDVFEEVTNA